MSDRKLTLKGMVIDFTVHHLADDSYNIIISEMTDKGYVKLLTLELVLLILMSETVALASVKGFLSS